jgi:general secretion pathway protein E/type IV pilus assembly protein PilB
MEYIQIDPTLQHLITSQQAWHYHIVPCKAGGGCIELYADQDLFQPHHRDELEILFNQTVVIHYKSTEMIRQTLGRYYRKTDSASKQASTLSNIKSDDFLTTLISEAKRMHSSDIHIETYGELCRIRLRIDGRMLERYRIEKDIYPALVNKVKIKANIDIAEKRLPQDGRIIFKGDENPFDIRVSVLPTLNGEKIVLRLLNKDAADIEIHKLGFTDGQLDIFLEGIKKTHGIILISGPTGSGKTTTLYATLKILNKIETNILTIEDPVEYTLEGINQVQLREDIGLTFARALRTFLRQDPDIIMLGEIRDNETAQMAIRAALTGHLVLSTIHTNSAWGIISRLTDMGLPPFLLADTINLCIAQRLIRLLCPHCKEEKTFNTSQLPDNFKAKQAPATHRVAKGCDACYYTGYKGRKAIYEIVPVDAELSEKIKSNVYDINKLKEERNILSLADTAYKEFMLGNTTLEEIYPILLNNG